MFGLHRSRYVCDQGPKKAGHREGLPGIREQSHQRERQVQLDCLLHDFQLEG